MAARSFPWTLFRLCWVVPTKIAVWLAMLMLSSMATVIFIIGALACVEQVIVIAGDWHRWG